MHIYEIVVICEREEVKGRRSPSIKSVILTASDGLYRRVLLNIFAEGVQPCKRLTKATRITTTTITTTTQRNHLQMKINVIRITLPSSNNTHTYLSERVKY